MDANSLPKGHIIGWTPPPSTTKPGAPSGSGSGTTSLSKNAKKRQKQREKKVEALVVKDNWDDDEDEEKGTDVAPVPATKTTSTGTTSDNVKESGTLTHDQPDTVAASGTDGKDGAADGLASEFEKLEIRKG